MSFWDHEKLRLSWNHEVLEHRVRKRRDHWIYILHTIFSLSTAITSLWFNENEVVSLYPQGVHVSIFCIYILKCLCTTCTQQNVVTDWVHAPRGVGLDCWFCCIVNCDCWWLRTLYCKLRWLPSQFNGTRAISDSGKNMLLIVNRFAILNRGKSLNRSVTKSLNRL